jgi:uncharacterized membrane protein YesL
MLQSVDKLNRVLNRVLQLVYLNFLWGGLVIAGLGIFTIGPASYAMVAVMRQWLRSDDMFPLTKTYFSYFKSGYKESLVMSWIYGIAGIILVIDLLYIQNWYLRAGMLLAAFFYLLSAIYIFQIMAHYDWKGYFFKIKMAFLFGFSQLHYSLVLMTVVAGVYLLLLQTAPGVLIFMGSSFYFFATTWVSDQVFRNLEVKNAYEEEHKQKSIIKTVKEKLHEKSNARKVRS